MLKTLLAVGLVMSAANTCSSPADEADASDSPETSSSSSSAESTPKDSVTPVRNNSSKFPPLDPEEFDLLYVSTTAPDCSAVWVVGGTLPANYEWCSKDEAPVAGVRIGSCEVVTFDNQMYAIPGRRIRAAAGEITRDPAFNRALTSCKRHPAPVPRRR